MLRFDAEIIPSVLYALAEAASKVGLSEYQFREIAVNQHKIAFIRHHPHGKILFRGRDIQEYLDSCRTPAIGERGRRAAQAAALKQ